MVFNDDDARTTPQHFPRFSQHELDNAWIFLACCGKLFCALRRNYCGKVDKPTFALRNDLLCDDEYIAGGEIPTVLPERIDDVAREIVTRTNVTYPSSREQLDSSARNMVVATHATRSGDPRDGNPGIRNLVGSVDPDQYRSQTLRNGRIDEEASIYAPQSGIARQPDH